MRSKPLDPQALADRMNRAIKAGRLPRFHEAKVTISVKTASYGEHIIWHDYSPRYLDALLRKRGF